MRKCIPTNEKLGKGQPKRLFLLKMEATYLPEYRLFLETPDSITLKKLDELQRAIWLECCGHLSAFEIHGQRYEVIIAGDEFFYERPKSMRAAKVEKS